VKYGWICFFSESPPLFKLTTSV